MYFIEMGIPMDSQFTAAGGVPAQQRPWAPRVDSTSGPRYARLLDAVGCGYFQTKPGWWYTYPSGKYE